MDFRSSSLFRAVRMIAIAVVLAVVAALITPPDERARVGRYIVLLFSRALAGH